MNYVSIRPCEYIILPAVKYVRFLLHRCLAPYLLDLKDCGILMKNEQIHQKGVKYHILICVIVTLESKLFPIQSSKIHPSFFSFRCFYRIV